MITVNGIEINPTFFPDNTRQVWNLPDKLFQSPTVWQLVWRYENDGELLTLCQLLTLINNVRSGASIYIDCPYLPFGRQDHRVVNNNTFGLYTFAYIINGFSYTRFRSFDVHSDVAKNNISGFENVQPTSIINRVRDINYDYICFPDHGARNRYENMFQSRNLLHATKDRDPQSGHIKKIEFEQMPDMGKRILVMDDICDGGATFLTVGETLRDTEPERLDLYVSHGIFSRGCEALYEYYDDIITTNSYYPTMANGALESWGVIVI